MGIKSMVKATVNRAKNGNGLVWKATRGSGRLAKRTACGLYRGTEAVVVSAIVGTACLASVVGFNTVTDKEDSYQFVGQYETVQCVDVDTTTSSTIVNLANGDKYCLSGTEWLKMDDLSEVSEATSKYLNKCVTCSNLQQTNPDLVLPVMQDAKWPTVEFVEAAE